ncbi:MAG: DUF1361 domain-containing protein [Myxococcales bacterium]|nr:DUF1361 domain-containing protein [Myxococcales bacterium]
MPIRIVVAGLLPALAAVALICSRSVVGEPWPWLLVNLGLALIPLALAAPMRPGGRSWLAVPWLAFFPNAPYLVSDLVHYADRPPVPTWLDAAMLGSTAAAGLMAGAISAVWVARCLAPRLGSAGTAVASGIVCVLCGRAIELGRVQRHNSWDLVLDPLPVLWDLTRSVAAPLEHAETWAITAAYALVVAGFAGAVALLMDRQ